MTAGTEPALAHLLSQVESRVTRRLINLLRANDCALEEWRVLGLLADGVGRPMSEIADWVIIPAPTLTKVIDRMVAANLVCRRSDPTDRRKVVVLVARRGVEKYQAVGTAVEAEQEELAQLLGSEHVAGLTQALFRLAEALR